MSTWAFCSHAIGTAAGFGDSQDTQLRALNNVQMVCLVPHLLSGGGFVWGGFVCGDASS
jgi:hypothetical protein